MTGGALLSVFWPRVTVEQEERSTAQHKNRQMWRDGIWNLPFWRDRGTSIRQRYITALEFRVGLHESVGAWL